MIARAGTHLTWFLGKPWRWTDATGHVWHDSGAQANGEGAYASGLPIETPGIALPNHGGTLGGWWRVAFPRLGMTATVRQVDVGPETGVIDLSAPLAFKMFGSPGALVDHSPWTATYLGKTLPDGEAEGVVKTKET